MALKGGRITLKGRQITLNGERITLTVADTEWADHVEG
jgi:hypothetical protein